MKKSTKLVSAVVVLAVLGGVYVGLNTYVSKDCLLYTSPSPRD